MRKIEKSIRLIKKAEALALKYNDFGFHLAFSGGKDSQVIYELCKMAGVKFKAFFYKTSIDPPELLSFVRNHYPDVTWVKPPMTMFQLIYKKGCLPWRKARYCCQVLKEGNGNNSVVILGIRKQESNARSKRQTFTHECTGKGDKHLLSPILDWTTREIWQFLYERKIETCPLYEKLTRIGCVGCPMNTRTQRLEFVLYPNFKKAYINTIARLQKDKGKYLDFESPEDVINWWASGASKKKWFAMKKQLSLFADLPEKKAIIKQKNHNRAL